MKQSKTNYRGGEALVLTTAKLELAVTTSVGPRVVSLRSLKGKNKQNLFLRNPDNEERCQGLMYLRGGHRLWHSPEQIPRTYQPDDDPLAVKPLRNGVALAQPTEEKTGIQKAMKIELLNDATIKVTHALTNRGLWPVETAPWALTMLRAGGYGVLPLLPKGDHASGDLLPNYSIVPWTYTDLAFPCWEMHRDYIGINVPKCPAPQKLGITNYPGWSAYWVNGTAFVKYSPVKPNATYPDLGSAFETFSDGKMIEFETLGALTKLAPETSVTHTEHWTLLDGIEKPSTDKAFSKLKTAVEKWLKTLK